MASRVRIPQDLEAFAVPVLTRSMQCPPDLGAMALRQAYFIHIAFRKALHSSRQHRKWSMGLLRRAS